MEYLLHFMSKVKCLNSTRSGLFLIELIVAILFFSLSGAICIQLFAKAHIISNDSKNLTMALNQAQSVTEAFKASNGTIKDVKALIGAENGDKPNEIVLKFDKSWQSVKSEESYLLTVSLDEENPVTANIVICDLKNEDKPIYNIEAKKYIPLK